MSVMGWLGRANFRNEFRYIKIKKLIIIRRIYDKCFWALSTILIYTRRKSFSCASRGRLGHYRFASLAITIYMHKHRNSQLYHRFHQHNTRHITNLFPSYRTLSSTKHSSQIWQVNSALTKICKTSCLELIEQSIA